MSGHRLCITYTELANMNYKHNNFSNTLLRYSLINEVNTSVYFDQLVLLRLISQMLSEYTSERSRSCILILESFLGVPCSFCLLLMAGH